MYAARLLHDLFDNACQTIDKRLRKTLFEAADMRKKLKDRPALDPAFAPTLLLAKMIK